MDKDYTVEIQLHEGVWVAHVNAWLTGNGPVVFTTGLGANRNDAIDRAMEEIENLKESYSFLKDVYEATLSEE